MSVVSTYIALGRPRWKSHACAWTFRAPVSPMCGDVVHALGVDQGKGAVSAPVPAP